MSTKNTQPETAGAQPDNVREEIKSITVIGKRWFDKINGNTYHSAQTLVNGKPGPAVSFRYGYGNQFEWEAEAELERAGFIQPEHYKNGGRESLWRYCDERNIAYTVFVSDVSRKRDL